MSQDIELTKPAQPTFT